MTGTGLVHRIDEWHPAHRTGPMWALCSACSELGQSSTCSMQIQSETHTWHCRPDVRAGLHGLDSDCVYHASLISLY